MRRELAGGFELDDDRERIDVDAVHAFISGESYWGRGRARERVVQAVAGSRACSGSTTTASRSASRAPSPTASRSPTSPTCTCSADYRGRGLGLELVREIVERARSARCAGCCTQPTRRGCTSGSASARASLPYPLMERAPRRAAIALEPAARSLPRP